MRCGAAAEKWSVAVELLIGLGIWVVVCLLVVALCMMAGRADARRGKPPGAGRAPLQRGDCAAPSACAGHEQRRVRRRPPRAIR